MNFINRKRALLVSNAIILLCLTIIAGMTFALFTDTERVSNHLKAGNLNITLERVKLTSTYLNDRGFLETEIDEEPKDFTDNKNENVFGIDGEVIVPMSTYSADMKLTNKSNVAFSYWIEIVYLGGDKDDATDFELAEQLTVSVTTKDGTFTDSDILKTGVGIGDAQNPVGVLAVGENAEFTVSVLFENLEDKIETDPDTGETKVISNNLAQNDDVYFDLIVHAVQYTEPDPNNQTP